MKPNELIAKIENGELDKSFKKIYVSDSAVEEQKPRYIRTIKEFINLFINFHIVSFSRNRNSVKID